jgi:hypothetical protein
LQLYQKLRPVRLLLKREALASSPSAMPLSSVF